VSSPYIVENRVQGVKGSSEKKHLSDA
jgi:hypothetical protein